jgi:hypothetical protein
VHLFRPVEGRVFEIIPPKGNQRTGRKRRVWNESLMVCDNCQPTAQQEYRYRSFVPPHRYEAECNVGC